MPRKAMYLLKTTNFCHTLSRWGFGTTLETKCQGQDHLGTQRNHAIICKCSDICAIYFADCVNAEGFNACGGCLPDFGCEDRCKFTTSMEALGSPNSSAKVPLPQRLHG
eukprot:2400084-Ditylum_brightwellii.AAC.1